MARELSKILFWFFAGADPEQIGRRGSWFGSGGAEKFSEIGTRVRCMQQFQILTTDRRLSIHVLKEIFTIAVPNRFQKGAPDLLQLGEGGAIGPSCPP